MNVKKQKIRRRKIDEVEKYKAQRAQDIYETKKKAKGSKVSRNEKDGEYTIKKYDYNMFEYGDPYAIKIKSPATTSMNKRQKNTQKQAKRNQKSKAKKEQKRLVRWGQKRKEDKDQKKKSKKVHRRLANKDRKSKVKESQKRKADKTRNRTDPPPWR